MSVKGMKYITVEDVLALRQHAIELEAERDALVERVREAEAREQALAADAERYRCLKVSATGGSVGLPDGWLDASDPESWDEIIDSIIQENTGETS